jgi:hypothetical protein
MKELRQLYGGRKPKSYRLAHNHIIHTPDFPHGLNGQILDTAAMDRTGLE